MLQVMPVSHSALVKLEDLTVKKCRGRMRALEVALVAIGADDVVKVAPFIGVRHLYEGLASHRS